MPLTTLGRPAPVEHEEPKEELAFAGGFDFPNFFRSKDGSLASEDGLVVVILSHNSNVTFSFISQ
jgi:hypothetical protein